MKGSEATTRPCTPSRAHQLNGAQGPIVPRYRAAHGPDPRLKIVYRRLQGSSLSRPCETVVRVGLLPSCHSIIPGAHVNGVLQPRRGFCTAPLTSKCPTKPNCAAIQGREAASPAAWLGGASRSWHAYPFPFSTRFQFTFPQSQRTLVGFLSTVAICSILLQLLHMNKLYRS